MDQIAEWRISHHIFFMRIYAPMSRNIAWQKLTSFIRWNHKTLCSCNLAQWTLFQFIYFPLMDYYSQKQRCFQCQSRIHRAFLNKPSTHGFWWILHDFWFYIVKNTWTSALLGSIPLFPTSFWTAIFRRIRQELLGLSSVLAFEVAKIGTGERVVGLYYWPGREMKYL